MTEAFLHYVWQYQYFDKSALTTTDGETVSVFNPGFPNAHAGPDFFNARIRIGGMDWVGNVEIHIHASGWTDHKHDADDAYGNVILHVVWNEDKKIKHKDTSRLPTIELKSRVAEQLLLHYRKLVNSPGKIPCAASLGQVTDLTRLSMLDKALMYRLEARAFQIQNIFKYNNNDWEETTYQLLSRNFGFKVNAEPFEQLARSLPCKILQRHANQPQQVEALLFGQAGFLDEKLRDDYFSLLCREYSLLEKKYSLHSGRMNKAQWRFLRLRPANFPSLRLAQLASLVCREKNIFSKILEARSFQSLHQLFSVEQSVYWQHHYRFFKSVPEKIPPLGSSSINNLIINTVVPLQVSYGKIKDDPGLIDCAVEILQHVSPEDNAIVKNWKALGFKITSAADSQALIELHNSFCLKRRCLDCNIGFSILQPAVS
jgi:hypothetical protein